MKGIEVNLFMFLVYKLDEIKLLIWIFGVVEFFIEIFFKFEKKFLI